MFNQLSKLYNSDKNVKLAYKLKKNIANVYDIIDTLIIFFQEHINPARIVPSTSQ